MSHGACLTRMKESRHTYECVTSRIQPRKISMRHHCSAYLQRPWTHCNTLQHTAAHCNTLQHSATHCNTLQHTATHCNTYRAPRNFCARSLRQFARMNESSHTYERVMSYIWMSHGTKWMIYITNESRYTYKWVVSYIRMSHVSRMHESSCAYEWIMSHIRMSHVLHMNGSCHTYEWVTHMNGSCRTCEWVMSRLWMSRSTLKKWRKAVTSHCTSKCVMAHTVMAKYKWFISRIWMIYVIHTNESCHAYEW